MGRQISLKKLLKDADKKVRQAAADALNKSANELKAQIRENMATQNIEERTGALRTSIESNIATPENLAIVIKSEVYKPAPERPGQRNPAMRGRYRNGVPYGRIIEFSPRINRPFFYTAWYKRKKQIKEDVIKAINKAWSDGK